MNALRVILSTKFRDDSNKIESSLFVLLAIITTFVVYYVNFFLQ